MAANNYQFSQTYSMFCDALPYTKDISYNNWLSADDEYKAAMLYVNFYKEITLAWCNAVVSRGIVFISQDDGVSTVLQYLMKNVPIIMAEPSRYTKEYIYRISYNCFSSLWATRGTEQQRCSVEIANEYTEGDVDVNLWDLVPSTDEDLETQQTKEAIWNIIRHMGPKAEKVVNHLINPSDTLHKVSRKASDRDKDRLADVSVSPSEYDAIVAELRVQLAPYKDVLLTF